MCIQKKEVRPSVMLHSFLENVLRRIYSPEAEVCLNWVLEITILI